MVSTTLVAVLKKENSRQLHTKKKPKEETQGVMETYKLLLSIIKMPTVFTFCALLLTAKVKPLSSLWSTSCFNGCNFVITCKSTLSLLSDWFLCSGRRDGAKASGSRGSQRAAGSAGGSHGASADPAASDY